MPITRLGQSGYGVRRTGSFAGKTPAGSLTLDAAAGAYTITGAAATFDLSMLAASGSYAHTGAAAAFDTSLSAAVGAYTITGFSATLTATGVSGKSGISRLTSIEAQRAADRQKKRKVTYAVDAIREDVRQARPKTVEESAKVELEQLRRHEEASAPASIVTGEYSDPIADALTAVAKSIRRRQKKDAARLALALKSEEGRLAERQKAIEAEARRKVKAEAVRLADLEVEKARIKAEAVNASQAAASQTVADILSATIEHLDEARKRVRAKVRASAAIEGVSAEEVRAITDKAMEVITTEDVLVLAMMEMEKRHKKAMMKMAMLLS